LSVCVRLVIETAGEMHSVFAGFAPLLCCRCFLA